MVLNKLQREGYKFKTHNTVVNEEEEEEEEHKVTIKVEQQKKPKKEDVLLFGEELVKLVDPSYVPDSEDNKSEVSASKETEQAT